MSLTNENNSYVDNFDYEVTYDLIHKLHIEQSDKEKQIRTFCPACKEKDFAFAFDKYNFHYIECPKCMSLYVQNSLNDNDTKIYNQELNKQLYNNEKYNDYLKNIIDVKAFNIDLVFSRLFNKKQEINIAYLGNKKILYETALKEFNTSFTFLELPINEEENIYDIVIIDSFIEKLTDIDVVVKEINSTLKENGFLYITMKTGSGIDILTLWEDSKLYPIEHNNLLSIEGIKILLKNNKFYLKELNTPGILDVNNILKTNSKNIPKFLEYLQRINNQKAIDEFQVFLQKNLLSSFATIVAQKVEKQKE